MADLLLLARALFGEGLPGAPGAGTKPGQARGPLPKEQKKFYKLGNPPPAAPAPVTGPAPAPAREPAPAPALEAPTPKPAAPAPEGDGEEEDDEKEPLPAATATTATAGERVAIRPSNPPASMEERTAGRRRTMNRRQRVLMIGMGVASAAGSFFVGLFLGWLGRPSVPKTPGPGPAAVQTPTAAVTLAARALAPDEGLRRALVTIDEAETARAAGDWMRMDALLEQSGREGGPRGVPGLTFQRAENAVRRGDLNAANVLAQRALEAGEDVAKAYALRAVIAQRSKRPEVALPLLEAAGRADPFESRYLFYQAQSLRGQGKLQEAIARLRRGLDRVEDAATAESYRLVLRLAQVELGEDAAFGEELARRLAEPNPAPDWLVTAAARECQAGRFREGAEFLRRAFAQAGPGYAPARLADVFFRPYVDRPELASLFAQYLPPPPPPPAPVATPKPTPGLLMPSGEPVVTQLPLFGPESASTPAGAAAATPQP